MQEKFLKKGILTSGINSGDHVFLVTPEFAHGEQIDFLNFAETSSSKQKKKLELEDGIIILNDVFVILLFNPSIHPDVVIDMKVLGQRIEFDFIQQSIDLAEEFDRMVIRRFSGIPVQVEKTSNPELILVELHRIILGLSKAEKVVAHPKKPTLSEAKTYSYITKSPEINFINEWRRFKQRKRAITHEELDSSPELICDQGAMSLIESLIPRKKIHFAKCVGRLIQSKVNEQSVEINDAISEAFEEAKRFTGIHGVHYGTAVKILTKVNYTFKVELNKWYQNETELKKIGSFEMAIYN